MTLRQFPGRDREHHVIDTLALGWQAGSVEGIAYKPLYAPAGFSDSTRLERREAGTSPGSVGYPEGAGLYVFAGEWADDQAVYAAGTWLRFPVGGIHEPLSSPGCTLYAKHGGLAYLRGADD